MARRRVEQGSAPLPKTIGLRAARLSAV